MLNSVSSTKNHIDHHTETKIQYTNVDTNISKTKGCFGDLVLYINPSTVGEWNISTKLSDDMAISGHSIKDCVALQHVTSANDTISTAP